MSSKKTNKVIDLRKWSSKRPDTRQSQLPLRRTSLRAKRRKTRALVTLAILVVLAGFAEGMSWITYRPALTVNEVNVSGTQNISSNVVRAYIESQLASGAGAFFSQENIFLFPKEEIAEHVINNFPRIQSAEISRNAFLAQAIQVVVTEREPEAMWCAENGACYSMDASGFIFSPASASATSSLIFYGGLSATSSPIGMMFLPEHLQKMFELSKRLTQTGRVISAIVINDDPDFSITFSDGVIMRASFEIDPSTLVRNLQLALSSDTLKGKKEKLNYIDLRFGNRVYYKFK